MPRFLSARMKLGLHAAAEVERVVDQHVRGRYLALGRLPARRGRGGEHEPHVRVPLAHRAHELPRHLHLAHAHGMDPDGRVKSGEGCRDFRRVSTEAVGEARAVPPAALHAQQEGWHHHRVRDGEQRVIQNPFHQFRNNCQARLSLKGSARLVYHISPCLR